MVFQSLFGDMIGLQEVNYFPIFTEISFLRTVLYTFG